MKRPDYFHLIACIFAMVSLFACKNEEQADKRQLLLGRWEIENATRDGSRAPSVEGLYFIFYEDGALQTNIAGSAETASYNIDGPVIQQRESRFEIDYAIEELNDSSLVLTTELRNAQFRFSLKKKAAEE